MDWIEKAQKRGKDEALQKEKKEFEKREFENFSQKQKEEEREKIKSALIKFFPEFEKVFLELKNAGYIEKEEVIKHSFEFSFGDSMETSTWWKTTFHYPIGEDKEKAPTKYDLDGYSYTDYYGMSVDFGSLGEFNLHLTKSNKIIFRYNGRYCNKYKAITSNKNASVRETILEFAGEMVEYLVQKS